MKRLPLILLSSLLAVLLVVFWPRPGVTSSGRAAVDWLQPEPSSTATFARAYGPTELEFPRDFGPHPDYQTEWWYYTGTLAAEDGRQFGYQLTFFRRALSAEDTPASDSDWRTKQIYFSHFTLSDIENQQFYPHERFSRQSADLAGAQAEPYRVWLENWSAEAVGPNQVHLVAHADDVALDLTLTATRPPVLQGDRGYSPKGPEAGNASYYYSIVQQATEGTLTVGGEAVAVTGKSWKDHEYSTSALSPGTVGWDWFSLQLDNGAALMLFALRQEGEQGLTVADGTFVAADGAQTRILPGDCEVTVLETWHSKASGATYPARWQVEIPKLDLALEGAPMMANQELQVSNTYWEGATAFEGSVAEEPVAAQGYIEMTGYTASMANVL